VGFLSSNSQIQLASSNLKNAKALGIVIPPTLMGASARSAHDESGSLDVKPQQNRIRFTALR
jgi:hypothetical protein